MGQDVSKMGQDKAKMGPRWSKMAPRWGQDGPRRAKTEPTRAILPEFVLLPWTPMMPTWAKKDKKELIVTIRISRDSREGVIGTRDAFGFQKGIDRDSRLQTRGRSYRSTFPLLLRNSKKE